MTKFLLLLGLSVTVVLSSPLPAESQFRFVPWPGAIEMSNTVYEPGSMIVAEMDLFQFRFCLSTMSGGEDGVPEDCLFVGAPGAGIPAGTQLISSNETVASIVGEGSFASIRLHRPGRTVLRLRETGEKQRLLASYTLIVSPIDAGTGCSSAFLPSEFIIDCSGQCVPVLPLEDKTLCPPGLPCVAISERISDGTCNFGRRLDDESRDIHLACRIFAFDGGDCGVDVLNAPVADCPEPPNPPSVFNVKQIRQALRDATCNNESQAINLNCPVFAYDKGQCR
jgi:hypothetical protein